LRKGAICDDNLVVIAALSRRGQWKTTLSRAPDQVPPWLLAAVCFWIDTE